MKLFSQKNNIIFFLCGGLFLTASFFSFLWIPSYFISKINKNLSFASLPAFKKYFLQYESYINSQLFYDKNNFEKQFSFGKDLFTFAEYLKLNDPDGCIAFKEQILQDKDQYNRTQQKQLDSLFLSFDKFLAIQDDVGTTDKIKNNPALRQNLITKIQTLREKVSTLIFIPFSEENHLNEKKSEDFFSFYEEGLLKNLPIISGIEDGIQTLEELRGMLFMKNGKVIIPQGEVDPKNYFLLQIQSFQEIGHSILSDHLFNLIKEIELDKIAYKYKALEKEKRDLETIVLSLIRDNLLNLEGIKK